MSVPKRNIHSFSLHEPCSAPKAETNPVYQTSKLLSSRLPQEGAHPV